MVESVNDMNLNASKSISEILREVSGIDDLSKKSSKVDFYVSAMEEEMRKIDAFKRELPNCMHLLKDAIEQLKEERLGWRGRGRKTEQAMKEFVQLKSDCEEDRRAKRSNDFGEKKDWMNSVQLWSTPIHYDHTFLTRNQDSLSPSVKRYQGSEGETQFKGCNFQDSGRQLGPFKTPSGVTIKEGKRSATVDGLSISTPTPEVKSIDSGVQWDCSFGRSRLQRQAQRKKQRRCWSPELHKRFVDALEQLGGALLATPKQIRELMRVKGLTNDEVKSHLQALMQYLAEISEVQDSHQKASNFNRRPVEFLVVATTPICEFAKAGTCTVWLPTRTSVPWKVSLMK